ncbi:diguanylate cyclase (GGDEF) domain-containing protein [Halopseudomonas xinjiangensis]|uniref:diguanylate cyclase n=1 Tax=Halopseudomonas xinjiangensis TaxID=487184 RepID=A0A1H1NQW1_9GAMM|nr:GGDEF domain-containing protein [Halopseudomonas xinjiangensis]SDS01362.1 diguanylate cyclase (GGDEF) domain-containing protein [Halopseudomonas xinjiangensis]
MPYINNETQRNFELYYNHRFLNRIRWAQIAAILLVVLFAILDVLSLPSHVWHQTLMIRFFIILPVFVLVWRASFIEALHQRLQWVITAAAVIAGLAIVGILWVARREQTPLPYEGIILVTIFFYFLVGLRYRGAMVCGWLTCVAYIVMEAQAGLSGEQLLYNSMFLISANVIGSVGCYFLDSATRQGFLAEQALRNLAERDPLTGLFNRRAFDERAERSLRQAVRERSPIAVAMIDIDFFKAYNDHYGHAEGDEALSQVGEVIRRNVQRPLDLAARYGGEEFIVLWYGLSEADALVMLETIRRDVEELGIAHARSDVADVITLSAGVVGFVPDGVEDLRQSLRSADQALYQSKQSGRNRVQGADTEASGFAR